MKKFNELYALDISAHTEERNGFTYLPWIKCLLLLRKCGLTVKYHALHTDVHPFPSSGIASMTATVHVVVEIDDETYRIAYPVADGDMPIVNPNSMQIHWAQQRAFVKCVAISTGLGLSLWEKSNPDKAKKDGNMGVDIVNLFGQLVPKFGTPADTYKEIGFSEKEMHRIVKSGSASEQQKVFDKLQSYFADDLQ